MASKLQILFSIVDTFIGTKKGTTFTNQQITAFLANSQHFKKQTSDQEWYAKVTASFAQAIDDKQDPYDWLADQLKQLGVYQASDVFQDNHTKGYNCMSFVSDLLHGKQDTKYCNPEEHFSTRMSSYISDSKAKPITQEELTTGDLIVYRGIYPNQKYDYIHAAISIEKTKGEMYAISKFGLDHKVFMHRIQDGFDNQREYSFFRSTIQLSPSAPAKFETIKAELHAALKQTTVQEIKNKGAPPLEIHLPKVTTEEKKLSQVASQQIQPPKVAAQEIKVPTKKSPHEMNGFGTRQPSGFLHLWPSPQLSSNKDRINEEGAPGERPNADPVFKKP